MIMNILAIPVSIEASHSAMLPNSRMLLRAYKFSQFRRIQKIHSSATENQHAVAFEVDTAQQFSEIPGPTPFKLITRHLPGGKYYKKGLVSFVNSFRDEYGNISKIPGVFGKSDIVLVYDPEDFKTVFQTQGSFPIRKGIDTMIHYRQEIRKDFCQGVLGVAVDQGQSWWELRHKMNAIMMKPQITRKYISVIDEVVQDFVKRQHNLRDANNETPDDFYNELNMWALESIAYIIMDTRLGIFDNTSPGNMHSLMKDLKVFFDLTFKLNFLPSFWKYFPTSDYKRLTKSCDNILTTIQGCVNIGIKKIKENSDDIENQGVLKKLLEIDVKVATIMIIDLLFAGIDTNPEKQEKLRKELLKILPEKNSPLTVENTRNMPYLRACIKEALRLMPVTYGNFRTTPERWIRPENSKITCPVNASAHPFAYLPFGFGTRMCIGRRFAEMEIESIVSRFVRHYNIEWKHPDPKIVCMAINMPVTPLKFRFTEIEA
uniref:Cytochrome n=1 Tax=Lutzomyia longipalpis TaxID=7200 RepID=A0A1B0CC91_LUTLO